MFVTGEAFVLQIYELSRVGVLPRAFAFPAANEMAGGARPGEISRYEIFQTLVPQEQDLTTDDSAFSFLVLARLRQGVSVKTAGSELDEMQQAYSLSNHLPVHLGTWVEPLPQEVTGSISKALWLLLAAVLAVLLIGCVNLASLQLARCVARDRDNAVRAALGAGRRHLFRITFAGVWCSLRWADSAGFCSHSPLSVGLWRSLPRTFLD
jgi:hypothetical protein